MIEKISSINNKKIKDACKLKLAKGRNETGLFIVEGFHILEMALRSNVVEYIFTKKELDNIDPKIPQYIVDDYMLDKISFMPTNQGVIAVCKQKEQVIDNSDLIVFLDGVSDPGNMGTILRTCLAFGVKNILLSEHSVSLYNDKVLMASQGAIFDLNVKKITYQELEDLKKEYKIAATTLSDKSINFDQLNVKNGKYIVVLGNESRGISNEVISLADYFIKIPMSSIDSLNVAIAAGIIIYYYSK